MQLNNENRIEILAYEAFIRRAAEVDYPFMLKGSYITRQYFSNPKERIPADLDWVFLNKLDSHAEAKLLFDDWATLVTENDKNDNVKYRSFQENKFWRRIDYAMAEDFPTINTDLKCWVDEKELNLPLDISFNLDIESPPIPLLYQPIVGEPFIIKNTVPLCLQISWKIHQTLVRPRFKDLFDLMNLVNHQSFNESMLNLTMQALFNECKKNNVGPNKIQFFLSYDLKRLFEKNNIEKSWDVWRHNFTDGSYENWVSFEDRAENITDPSKLPDLLSDFLANFRDSLEKAGFGIHLMGSISNLSENNATLNNKKESLEKSEAEIPNQRISKEDSMSFFDLLKRFLKKI
jgi:Nucleotidyl transferase AbiEii toxin, Type IV TA system